MVCHDLDTLIEGFADGSVEASADAAAHLASCPLCSTRLANARDIERALLVRDVPEAPANFTALVMRHIGDDQWHTERAFDLGFNLAMAAGVLVIVSGIAGLAWSLGLLTITIDVDALSRALNADVTGRMFNQLQTLGVSALLLTMALSLWWWAEAATD